MRKVTGRMLVILAAQLVLAGCLGGPMVKKESITGTARIAVVSVVLPRIADTSRETNRTALQEYADRVHARVQADLRSARTWTVVDPRGARARTALQSLGAFSDQEVAALLPPGTERKAAGEAIKREASQWNRSFLGARGLPVIPRAAVVGEKDDKTVLAMIPPIVQKRAASLCGTLGVDAVAFVQVLASVTHPRPKTFIVSGNRTDGTVHMAQTLVIVDRSGQVIVDMGWPPLDERARYRDLLPLYLGSGQDAVKQENIDLRDPKNKIEHAFLSLIDETGADMINRLTKAFR